eukprot:COSAG01_NODE_2181_length_8214_cov_2.850400_3_plen_92_part_00
MLLTENYEGYSRKDFHVALLCKVPIRIGGQVLVGGLREFSDACVGTGPSSDKTIVQFEVLENYVRDDSSAEEESDAEEDDGFSFSSTNPRN